MSTHPHKSTRVPRPYRAPDFADELAERDTGQSYLDGGPSEDRRGARGLDGWSTGRIRKRSRHWRPR